MIELNDDIKNAVRSAIEAGSANFGIHVLDFHGRMKIGVTRPDEASGLIVLDKIEVAGEIYFIGIPR